ncbi:hypothetical protein QYE76_054745 [Lolium multiflorum]|uniref:Uncharacterized protein n=1 Tax=Lolium multiflorum TaxID=4521 RepID=A0AAD8SYB2_LOLMU|nr:hypothetical protein QYE76_054745 [Lolium multiflorum]
MENYSLSHGSSSGDEDGGGDGSGVDGEAFRGHFPVRQGAGTDSCPQILASRWRRLWKVSRTVASSGLLPPALSLDSFPCVEEAIRVTDEFCDQYRALRREVEILQEENQRLRRMLEYYSIPITRPPPPHSDNNESLRVLVQNCQTEKLKLKEIFKKREKNPPSSPTEE